METLRITLVQSELHWEDPEANRRAFSGRLAHLSGQTDLVVLPEMFSTGFSMRAAELAEPPEGPTMQWMLARAKELNAVIAGSLIVAERGSYYNRLVWMLPDGNYHTYDKRHLFTLAGEDRHYTRGNSHLLLTYRGWKILPLICYDLRFPVWARNTQNYDLLLFVANWPERRVAAWNTLLAARAIENQCYVAGVNRVGEDGNGVYHCGDSALYDYAGRQLYRCTHQEDIFTAHLQLEPQRTFREKLAFLQDRDQFRIQY